MSLVESATSSYSEAVSSLIPLHRAALFLFSTLLFIVFRTAGEGSNLMHLLQLPVLDLTSSSSPLLRSAIMLDLAVGFASISIAAICARLFASMLFSLALRSTNLTARINQQALLSNSLSLKERMEAAELAKSSLEQPAKRIRAINRLGEFLGGTGLIIAFFGVRNSLLDSIVALVLLLASLLTITHAVRMFLSEYFGTAMYIARLLGHQSPSPNRLD